MAVRKSVFHFVFEVFCILPLLEIPNKICVSASSCCSFSVLCMEIRQAIALVWKISLSADGHNMSLHLIQETCFCQHLCNLQQEVMVI